jgi:hypothetical protein
MPHTERVRPPAVRVSIHDGLSHGVTDYARTKMTAVLRLAHEPVLAARVRLTRHADPAVSRPVIAQANLDVNGRLVRAVVAAPTAREAVDLLEAKLRHRLERIARHWEARRGALTAREPHEWRHTDEPAHRPSYFPRPADERQIIRHKSFSLPLITPDEAALEMETMDYDFHLFTEYGSGQDSVLYRAGPTGYRLAQVDPAQRHRISAGSLPVTVSATPAPMLSTDEAVARLNAVGLPFLFYLDGEHARGCVLYRRYDGHYGLVSPAG